jgi:uncharacterized protein (TIGR02996 family)
MTDGDALRRAIVETPDDDTPRLVYADWLDENGRAARAAFIRAQVEAARADPFGPQARKAAKRADDILEVHRGDWIRHLRGTYTEWPRFERGFVAHLSVEPTAFVRSADTIFDAEPVQALKLFRFAPPGGRVPLQPFFEVPRLRHICRFELSPRLELAEEEHAALSGCPHLAGLRDLSLRDNPIPPSWLSAVLTGGAFPELAGLDLAEIPNLGPILATAMPKAAHRELKRLDLTGVVFNSEHLQRVLTSRCLKRVEELRLGRAGAAWDEGPLFHLDMSFVIPWDRLVVLDLAGQRLGDGGVEEIVARKESAALRWLGLKNNQLGPEAVRLLAKSKHLALNHLDVRGNGLSLSDLDALHMRFPDAWIES